MAEGNYEMLAKLNGNFDKALINLKDCYAREIRELRRDYIET